MKSFLIILVLLCTLILAQEQDSIKTENESISMYEKGFGDGIMKGKTAGHGCFALAGCLSGLTGGCTFALLSHELLNFKEDENVNRIAVASGIGSIIAGGLIIYAENKIKDYPIDKSINDSLYLAGFIDGYKKATKVNRTLDTIGGWLIGSAVSVGVIYYVYGILSSIPMK